MQAFGFIWNLIILSLGGTASAPRREETKGEKETQTGKGGEKDGQGRSIIIWDGTGYQICRISGIVARQANGYPAKAVYLVWWPDIWLNIRLDTGYPTLISVKSDISPETKFDIRPDNSYKKAGYTGLS